MSAVTLEHVTKTFGSHTAVADLDLDVPAGSICGFIGPNGSGKTTTLRMIVRILLPDRGVIRVLGREHPTTRGRASVLDRVAYLPEERGLYKQMKVRDVLRFYAELKGCRNPRPAIDAWLERLDLAAWAGKKVETLSKGMSQKVQFIAAVVARPELVLLDEPFSGLDPVNAEVLRQAILDLRREGTTILFSTHDMAVAEKMCDRVFMIFQGRKVLDGTVEEIQDTYGEDTVRVRLEDGSGSLDDVPGVVKASDFGCWQELRLAPGTDPQEVLARLMQRGRVRHFELARPTLQDVFVRIAGPQAEPAIEVEQAVPANDSKEALLALHLELSDRVRRGELQGFVDIGPDVYQTTEAGKTGDLLYQTNRPTIQDFSTLVARVVREQVEDARWRKADLDPAKVRSAMQELPRLETRGLSTKKEPEGGKQSLTAAFLVPFGVIMLMFMVILLTATPLMQGVVEEKMQRIAEVLLGSVRPFDLMLGKLLGMTAVSLTISAVYLGGGWWAARRYDFAPEVSAEFVAWFVAYQVLAALMYGSLFAAVGAACTDMKETQTLMWPVMVLVVVPLGLFGAVVQEPNGSVVTGLSFFPFATPMLMIARQAVPPGVPWWQPVVGAVGVLLTTLLCVWAAGRIFRVGILLQGKGARLGDLVRWVLRG